ncbi:MAG: aldo/keto reductase [Pseudonocardiales bacterium]|nr:aldo/keto reductase [Pseudonocardiales bacterium]
MGNVSNITGNNGVEIPQLGLGVFLVEPNETQAVVAAALDVGYRHIDTAAAYNNEAEVGAAIADADLPRDELFITTKVWNLDQGHDRALAAFDLSLGKLGLDYLDLYLIHWPAPGRDRYVETWRAMEKILAEGRVRSIGVSNFGIEHLQRLIDETETVPAVNQVELHPNLPQRELRGFHAEHGIVTEAWSPLARGELLDDASVRRIADAHGKTPAQVLLRWHIELGNVVIPKSRTPERIAENIEVFDFELTPEDHETITALENGHRIGPHPDSFNG